MTRKIFQLYVLCSGIASGKSTTANIFKEKKIPVIDADVLARQGKQSAYILTYSISKFIEGCC